MSVKVHMVAGMEMGFYRFSVLVCGFFHCATNVYQIMSQGLRPFCYAAVMALKTQLAQLTLVCESLYVYSGHDLVYCYINNFPVI